MHASYRLLASILTLILMFQSFAFSATGSNLVERKKIATAWAKKQFASYQSIQSIETSEFKRMYLMEQQNKQTNARNQALESIHQSMEKKRIQEKRTQGKQIEESEKSAYLKEEALILKQLNSDLGNYRKRMTNEWIAKMDSKKTGNLKKAMTDMQKQVDDLVTKKSESEKVRRLKPLKMKYNEQFKAKMDAISLDVDQRIDREKTKAIQAKIDAFEDQALKAIEPQMKSLKNKQMIQQKEAKTKISSIEKQYISDNKTILNPVFAYTLPNNMGYHIQKPLQKGVIVAKWNDGKQLQATGVYVTENEQKQANVVRENKQWVVYAMEKNKKTTKIGTITLP